MTPQATSKESKPSSPVSVWTFVIGVPFGGLAGFWFFLAANARIDSPEEFDMALRLSSTHAVPLALASVFLGLGFTRHLSSPLRFVSLAGVGLTVWFLCCQLLQHSYYSQFRSRGVDPEQVLRSVRPHSMWLNPPAPGNGATALAADVGRLGRAVPEQDR